MAIHTRLHCISCLSFSSNQRWTNAQVRINWGLDCVDKSFSLDDLYYDRIGKGEGARDFSNVALFGGDSKVRQYTKFEKRNKNYQVVHHWFQKKALWFSMALTSLLAMATLIWPISGNLTILCLQLDLIYSVPIVLGFRWPISSQAIKLGHLGKPYSQFQVIKSHSRVHRHVYWLYSKS